ncbi:MAG: FeoC-like transcriptional regulator [Deltaproteobacteria bacterium]|nr:FeoC-like transcriptional regulator [Deltaproteobacteria bacterium]
MNISQIKSFLLERKEACLYDFSLHFKLPEEEINKVLRQLFHEGKVRKNIVAHCCNSGCSECYTDAYEFYSWIE